MGLFLSSTCRVARKRRAGPDAGALLPSSGRWPRLSLFRCYPPPASSIHPLRPSSELCRASASQPAYLHHHHHHHNRLHHHCHPHTHAKMFRAVISTAAMQRPVAAAAVVAAASSPSSASALSSKTLFRAAGVALKLSPSPLCIPQALTFATFGPVRREANGKDDSVVEGSQSSNSFAEASEQAFSSSSSSSPPSDFPSLSLSSIEGPTSAEAPRIQRGSKYSVNSQAWGDFMSVLDSSTGSVASSPRYSESELKRSRRPLEDVQDEVWANRSIIGHPPVTPSTGRTVNVRKGNVSQAYQQMMGILSRNKVAKEHIMGRRYEKPNQERRRKQSERHRTRFANMIRQKVKLVSNTRRGKGRWGLGGRETLIVVASIKLARRGMQFNFLTPQMRTTMSRRSWNSRTEADKGTKEYLASGLLQIDRFAHTWLCKCAEPLLPSAIKITRADGDQTEGPKNLMRLRLLRNDLQEHESGEK